MAKSVYKALRGELIKSGYTQTMAAAICGITVSTFSNKMTGKTPWLLDEIMTLVDLTNVPFEVLFQK